MPRNQEQTPEDMIAKLMLAAGFLMKKMSPSLVKPIEPTRYAIETKIVVVENMAEELSTIVTTARTILGLVQS